MILVDAADAVPAAEFRSLPGEWHGPVVEELAAAVVAQVTNPA